MNVVYGAPTGLTASGNQFWDQGDFVGESAESFDGFGSALAAGDFNGDGYDDLAIGVPNEDLGAESDIGVVHVLYGSLNGLTPTGADTWTQGSLGHTEDGSEPFDWFGWSLAAANFGRGVQADLAVGVPGEDVGSASDAGAMNLLYGSSSGLRGGAPTDGVQWLHQDSEGLAGDGAEGEDYFGGSIAAANFGKGSQADLAVAAAKFDDAFGGSGEAIGDTLQAGAVTVLYGSATGITTDDDQFWHQGRMGITGDGPQQEDVFGAALAADDLGRSPEADLAIGVPWENLGPDEDAGAVHVLYGGPNGLTAIGDQFWHQNRAGMAGGGTDPEDRFGMSLAAANFGNGSDGDLAIGVFEMVGGHSAAGAVHVLSGGPNGITVMGDRFWHQNRPGVMGGGIEETEWFGWSLAGANFGKKPQADLAIGAPFESIEPVSGAGAVNVLYGGPDGLTATGDQFWHQGRADLLDDAETDDRLGFSLTATPRRSL